MALIYAHTAALATVFTSPFGGEVDLRSKAGEGPSPRTAPERLSRLAYSDPSQGQR